MCILYATGSTTVLNEENFAASEALQRKLRRNENVLLVCAQNENDHCLLSRLRKLQKCGKKCESSSGVLFSFLFGFIVLLFVSLFLVPCVCPFFARPAEESDGKDRVFSEIRAIEAWLLRS